MKSFVDTNVALGYCINPDFHNKKSYLVFSQSSEIFWSSNVKNEFIDLYDKKIIFYYHFYELLYNYLKSNKFECLKDIFKECDLFEFIKNLNTNNVNYKIYKRTGVKFWNAYVNQTFPTVEDVKLAINECMDDFELNLNEDLKKWNKVIKLTPIRVKSYKKINGELKKAGVHYPDNEIVLDAHDFCINECPMLNFVTFDNDLCNSIRLIDLFLFNNVLCGNDFDS